MRMTLNVQYAFKVLTQFEVLRLDDVISSLLVCF